MLYKRLPEGNMASLASKNPVFFNVFFMDDGIIITMTWTIAMSITAGLVDGKTTQHPLDSGKLQTSTVESQSSKQHQNK